MNMPIMGGVEATKEIRHKFGRDSIIYALTANAFSDDKKVCLESGMDGFLTKPIKLDEVVEAIISAYKKKHLKKAV